MKYNFVNSICKICKGFVICNYPKYFKGEMRNKKTGQAENKNKIKDYDKNCYLHIYPVK